MIGRQGDSLWSRTPWIIAALLLLQFVYSIGHSHAQPRDILYGDTRMIWHQHDEPQ